MPSKDPIFKSVFKTSWERLPPVFQKRYANQPYTNEIATVEGQMEIRFSKFMSLIMPLLRLFHVLVPYQGKNIPVTVNFRSALNSDDFFLDRTFYFPGKPPYAFNSCVQVIKDAEVIERMAFGIGWKMHYFYDGKKIVMQHKGYVWNIFGYNMPLPLEIFIGKGHAEEEPIDDNSYRISMTISHALFGTLYDYSGNFTFKRLAS